MTWTAWFNSLNVHADYLEFTDFTFSITEQKAFFLIFFFLISFFQRNNLVNLYEAALLPFKYRHTLSAGLEASISYVSIFFSVFGNGLNQYDTVRMR